jgi:hypothetical protein
MISSEKIKPLLHQALELQSELKRYGGAEHAPRIWQEYANVRTRILKEMQLPETSYNKRILEMSSGASINSKDPFYRSEYSSLSEFMPPADHSASNDLLTNKEQRESRVDFICEQLFIKAKQKAFSRPINKYWFLRNAKKMKLPVTDVFLQLHIENQPYTRFLIHTILYGKYGSTALVLQEFDYVGQPEIEWLFILYNSSLVQEKRQASKWLRNTELQFIEQFLWFEEPYVFSDLFTINHQ